MKTDRSKPALSGDPTVDMTESQLRMLDKLAATGAALSRKLVAQAQAGELTEEEMVRAYECIARSVRHTMALRRHIEEMAAGRARGTSVGGAVLGRDLLADVVADFARRRRSLH